MDLVNHKMKNEFYLNNKMNLEENETVLLKTKKLINDIFEKLANPSIIPNIS